MASVIFHATRQIQKTGSMDLFKSHKKGIKDGAQQRDFIYVKDVVEVCHFLFKKQKESGLYNIGTGNARTCLLYTSPSPRDATLSRMPSSA